MANDEATFRKFAARKLLEAGQRLYDGAGLYGVSELVTGYAGAVYWLEQAQKAQDEREAAEAAAATLAAYPDLTGATP